MNTLASAEDVKKLASTESLKFLNMQRGLYLDDDDFTILRREKIIGDNILRMTEEQFRSYGMKGEPAERLVNFAEKVKLNQEEVQDEVEDTDDRSDAEKLDEDEEVSGIWNTRTR